MAINLMTTNLDALDDDSRQRATAIQIASAALGSRTDPGELISVATWILASDDDGDDDQDDDDQPTNNGERIYFDARSLPEPGQLVVRDAGPFWVTCPRCDVLPPIKCRGPGGTVDGNRVHVERNVIAAFGCDVCHVDPGQPCDLSIAGPAGAYGMHIDRVRAWALARYQAARDA